MTRFCICPWANRFYYLNLRFCSPSNAYFAFKIWSFKWNCICS